MWTTSPAVSSKRWVAVCRPCGTTCFHAEFLGTASVIQISACLPLLFLAGRFKMTRHLLKSQKAGLLLYNSRYKYGYLNRCFECGSQARSTYCKTTIISRDRDYCTVSMILYFLPYWLSVESSDIRDRTTVVPTSSSLDDITTIFAARFSMLTFSIQTLFKPWWRRCENTETRTKRKLQRVDRNASLPPVPSSNCGTDEIFKFDPSQVVTVPVLN